MRPIMVALLLFIHGSLHLIGFGKPFGWSVSRSIKSKVSVIAGMGWGVAALLFWTAAILLLTHNSWWYAALPAMLLSQTAVLFAWRDAKAATVFNLIILLLALQKYIIWRFNYDARSSTLSVLRSHDSVTATHDTAALPAAVLKWLHHSGAIYHRRVHTIRLQQRGQLRMNGKDKWRAMRAEQYFNSDSPSFVWLAHINYGLTHIAGWDTYNNGKGHMIIKLASAFKVADGMGPQADQGSMLRYLAELEWFPCNALDPYITWRPINDRAAMATISYGGITADGIFSFDSIGNITSFEAARYMEHNGSYSLEKWYVNITGYGSADGMIIPTKGSATWKLRTGDFEWFRWEIYSVEYDKPLIY